MLVEVPGFADVTPLDRGGFGAVFRATRVSTGGTVALKMLDAGPELDEVVLERRLRREIAALVALKGHPNVVQVEELVIADAGPVIVMEYMDAGSVAKLVESTSPPVERIGYIGTCLASALAAAHAAGIVHRDVKPHNALMNSYGQVKLCDFGIAAVVRSTEVRTRTTSLSVRYASPEELDDDPDVGPPTDVYSLGATLYHLLHGAPPSFRGRGVPDVDATIVRHDGDPVRQRLDLIIDVCLQVDPTLRPTAAEVYDLLIELGGANGNLRDDSTVERVAGAITPLHVVSDATVLRAATAEVRANATAPGTMLPATTPPATTQHGVPGRRSWLPLVIAAVALPLVGGVVGAALLGGDSADTSTALDGADTVDGDGPPSVNPNDAPVTSEAQAVAVVTPTTAPPTVLATLAPAPPLATTGDLTNPPAASPTIVQVSASTVRSDSTDACGNPTSYQPGFAVDGLNDTAWMAPGSGLGASLTIDLATPAVVQEVGLIPGYDKFDPCTGTDRFFDLRRVTSVRWTFDDGTTIDQALSPTPEFQTIPVGRYLVASQITMSITGSTEPGIERLDHTPVSEIAVR